ncbi:uncharacterized protein MCYG_02994 [Microsporum canis CBS 113480]|uniref:Uncharacterized protein n=1 Tax=Arthroderma otae (strain ATCC MYA-4605 / CBS 113480) TaxID=554155 RepID=C5FKF3_ARTOC|nr:uncharacterized protein MCYG_02994 [Microsporum canis CBS 113480]EEQ30175.1 predicted protein [Microsporum canis CBS 113480]
MAMRHDATVTATVDGGTNSVSVSVTALASGEHSHEFTGRSCAVFFARDTARKPRSSDPEKKINKRTRRQRAELRPNVFLHHPLALAWSSSRWIFDVGSFDVAEPRRVSVRPGPWQQRCPPRSLGPGIERSLRSEEVPLKWEGRRWRVPVDSL